MYTINNIYVQIKLLYIIHPIVPKNALLNSFSYHYFLKFFISIFYTLGVSDLIRQFVPNILAKESILLAKNVIG